MPHRPACPRPCAWPCLGSALVGLVSCGGPGPEAGALSVAAAASLREPLQALSAEARVSFASSGTLARQIEAGAPLDVFLSASPRQMERLERQGLLLPGSRRDLLGNRLVLVVPARSPRRALEFPGLADPAVGRIAIGDGSVPAGDYARQTLAHYGLTAAVRRRLVPLGSVRAVAQAVAAGNVEAGLVYASDAQTVKGLRPVAVAPAASHDPIRYSAAVLRGSRRPQQARAWIASLSTPRARAEFRRFGLLPLAEGGEQP